jgi:polysaccharide export outer membrane protein
MPIIGTLRVEGLTSEALEQRLTELYRPYVRSLTVSVAVDQPRPINVSVLGEVNRPGPYTLLQASSVDAGNSVSLGTGAGASTGSGSRNLTVSQALRLAGGVTEVADVQSILLVRRLPEGEVTRRKVDLWALFKDADTSQDLTLLDGDALMIPRAAANKPGYDANLIASSSLAPTTVEVKVLGEVKKPGLTPIRPNAPFTDALVAAGGLTNYADPRNVQLIRLNADGTISRWQIPAVLEQGRDPDKNPALQRGDLIVVSRSLGGDIVSTLNDASGSLNLLGNLIFLVRNLTRLN